MNFARELWLRMETAHAVSYFGEETDRAGRQLGMSGFWMGYFALRSAPFGPVGAGVVEASFCNFAPSFVRRWVPQVWQVATIDSLLHARRFAAAATLSRLVVDVAAVAEVVNPVLEAAADRAIAAGRPLFAANRDLPLPDDRIERFWQLCTSLREHRGDGHVAALTAAGLDGLEAHVLIAAEQHNSPEDLQRTRGWTPSDWTNAVERCRQRGLVDGEAALTERGRALRADIEARTDALAAAPFESLTDDERHHLITALDPLARAVAASGVIRYPNPIGLPVLS